jgi:uncharacterized protein YdhG (YjbR/CyaY superfamily)
MATKTSKTTTAARGGKAASGGFSKDEQAAMKERARELKAEARMNKDREAGESAVQAAIAAMPAHDRQMAERIHAIVKETAPQLMPKTWYGMPAYARDGKVVVFFKAASKFGMRYADLGFNEEANLDDGAMWPDAFALKDIGPAEEKRIAALVKKAVS